MAPVHSFVRFAGVIQLVECQLPKLDVVGSSPIARSLKVVLFEGIRSARSPTVTRRFFHGYRCGYRWCLLFGAFQRLRAPCALEDPDKDAFVYGGPDSVTIARR